MNQPEVPMTPSSTPPPNLRGLHLLVWQISQLDTLSIVLLTWAAMVIAGIGATCTTSSVRLLGGVDEQEQAARACAAACAPRGVRSYTPGAPCFCNASEGIVAPQEKP